MKKTKSLIAKTGKMLLVFGFIFSQLSFPLTVFADEISELNEVVEDEAVNTNGEVSNIQTEISLVGEEKNITEPEQIDFTVEIKEEIYIIKNKLNKKLTVKQLKDYDEEITKVLNEENTEVEEETEIIKSGYQVEKVAEDLTNKIYTIIILADYDNDGMITEIDKELLLDILKTSLKNETLESDIHTLDLNNDNTFDILDITYPIFNEDKWENDKVSTDNLENYLMPSLETVYLDEEIEVNYYIENFQNDSLLGIQGKINYDDTLLELTKIKINEEEKDITELLNNNFIYLLDNYNKDGILMTLTFKPLAVGIPVVSIENIVASIGGTKALIDSDKVSTSFEILEYGKGGNEEENNQPEIIEPSVTEPEEIKVIPTTRQVKLLSNDNSIKSLLIEGYEIDFNPNTYEYSIKVKHNVNSLGISVLLNSDKAIYYIEGNENFKVGENIVYIVVKAENGSSKTYTIKVEKEKKELKKEKVDTDEESADKTSNTSRTIIIILIVLVIIGLIYVIFKDDEEDVKEKTKENKTKKGSKK